MSPRRPKVPTDPRLVAESTGAAIERELPPDGNGLGPVGEQIVRYRLTPENEGDPEDRRDVVWFTREWRHHIRRMTPKHLDAVYVRADRDVERAVLTRFWGRIRKGAVAVAVAAFAAAAWGVEQIPVIRELWKAGRELVAWWHGG